MNIDLRLLILNLLPTFLRKLKTLDFLFALLCETRKGLNDFSLFAADTRYKAAANASVISLEQNIMRECGAAHERRAKYLLRLY